MLVFARVLLPPLCVTLPLPLVQAKNLADPFAYDRYREERVQAKMDAERAARITVRPTQLRGPPAVQKVFHWPRLIFERGALVALTDRSPVFLLKLSF